MTVIHAEITWSPMGCKEWAATWMQSPRSSPGYRSRIRQET